MKLSEKLRQHKSTLLSENISLQSAVIAYHEFLELRAVEAEALENKFDVREQLIINLQVACDTLRAERDEANASRQSWYVQFEELKERVATDPIAHALETLMQFIAKRESAPDQQERSANALISCARLMTLPPHARDRAEIDEATGKLL